MKPKYLFLFFVFTLLINLLIHNQLVSGSAKLEEQCKEIREQLVDCKIQEQQDGMMFDPINFTFEYEIPKE